MVQTESFKYPCYANYHDLNHTQDGAILTSVHMRVCVLVCVCVRASMPCVCMCDCLYACLCAERKERERLQYEERVLTKGR